MGGIRMIKVTITRNKSTLFLLLFRKSLDDGSQIAARMIMSTANAIVNQSST
jgi:chlorite dismutase